MKVVLVIEDNLECRENTAELLELAGYKVLTADNGKVGFEQALSNHPDIIICDIAMPIWDGSFFLEQIKKENTTKNILKVFISAGLASGSVLNEIESGESKFLSKPFSGEELLRTIAA